MSSNNSSGDSIFALSKIILNAQKISNCTWAVLCLLGLVMSGLQVITTLFWKPLRKVEQSLILAIAAGDFLKSLGFGLVAAKRLYLTIANGDEVSTQKMCMFWLFGIPASAHFVRALLVMVSLDRTLALVVPIWYKNRKNAFKLFLIAISAAVGIVSACSGFIGARNDLMLPVCAFGTSPTERYRKYATIYENATVVLTLLLNLFSCLCVLIRWRSAVKAKKDMKAFKKNIQFNALKTLMAVIILYLFSVAASGLWITLVTTSNWDDYTRMIYAPLSGLFDLIRGVFDFPLYLFMIKEYRRGFFALILKWRCSLGGTGSSVVPISNNAPRLTVRAIVAGN